MKDIIKEIKKLDNEIRIREDNCGEKAEHCYYSARDMLLKVEEFVRMAIRHEKEKSNV